MPNTHSQLSPSSSQRWMDCAGSIGLIQALNIAPKAGKAAEEGTTVHKIIELCLKNNSDSEYYLKHPDEIGYAVTAEMCERASIMLEYIRSKPKSYAIYSEVELDLSFMNVAGLDYGTSDVVVVDKERSLLEVVDYKNGNNNVRASNNPQLMIYAVGALHRFGMEHEGLVKMTIVQPATKSEPDSFVMDIPTLLRWRDEVLIPAAELAMSDDPPFHASEENCRYCPASGVCTHQKQYLIEQAKLDFDEPNLVIAVLTDTQKMNIAKYASHLKQFIDSVLDTVKQEMLSDYAKYTSYSAGIKLVRKNTRRRLKDNCDDEIMSPLLDYLTVDEIYERKMKSLSALEKLLKKKTDKSTADSVLGAITDKPLGEIEIAPLDDKRKSVSFDEIEEK